MNGRANEQADERKARYSSEVRGDRSKVSKVDEKEFGVVSNGALQVVSESGRRVLLCERAGDSGDVKETDSRRRAVYEAGQTRGNHGQATGVTGRSGHGRGIDARRTEMVKGKHTAG